MKLQYKILSLLFLMIFGLVLLTNSESIENSLDNQSSDTIGFTEDDNTTTKIVVTPSIFWNTETVPNTKISCVILESNTESRMLLQY